MRTTHDMTLPPRLTTMSRHDVVLQWQSHRRHTRPLARAVLLGKSLGRMRGRHPLTCGQWESGAMFGSLIDYWYYTGDSTYNDVRASLRTHSQEAS